jgi:hypothetical protein
MHIEHNILEIVLKYLFGERDTTKVRKDMEETNVKQHLWFCQDLSGTNYVKPPTPYVFTRDEKQVFLDFVSEVHAPTRYAIAFKKHIGPKRLYNMKIHDQHVMLQHIFLAGVWNLLHLCPRRAIICLGKTFQKLCTKVLNPSDIPNLKTYVAKTLSMLEIWWPSTFFDLQTHLIIHLVDELETCGLVGSKWCYPIE